MERSHARRRSHAASQARLSLRRGDSRPGAATAHSGPPEGRPPRPSQTRVFGSCRYPAPAPRSTPSRCRPTPDTRLKGEQHYRVMDGDDGELREDGGGRPRAATAHDWPT